MLLPAGLAGSPSDHCCVGVKTTEQSAATLNWNTRQYSLAPSSAGGKKMRICEPKRISTRAGEVVTRDELRDRLWPQGTFVDYEHSLNAAVKRLRAVLDDDAKAPRYIETLPRRGYRWIGSPHTSTQKPFATDGAERIQIVWN